jgi:Protein of unknown function (DUF2486)
MAEDPDSPIPVLTDVLVAGAPDKARTFAQWRDKHRPGEAFGAAPDAAAMAPDAERIAERLRGRVGAYLTGEGRELIEARCREALAEHSGWLISHVTREVALALETKMQAWVREAVSDEIERRNTEH